MAWHDRRRLAESFTYLIQGENGGPVKIGLAADPQKRLSELQTGNAQKLVVVAYYNGGDYEQELHLRFAHLRIRGEWFHESVLDELLPQPEPVASVEDNMVHCGECGARVSSERVQNDGWCAWCAAWVDSLAAA